MIDLLGWSGSALLVLSLLQRGMLKLRIINLAACVALVVFNWLVGVWPMVGMNAAVGIIDIYFVWRIAREARKREATAKSRRTTWRKVRNELTKSP